MLETSPLHLPLPLPLLTTATLCTMPFDAEEVDVPAPSTLAAPGGHAPAPATPAESHGSDIRTRVTFMSIGLLLSPSDASHGASVEQVMSTPSHLNDGARQARSRLQAAGRPPPSERQPSPPPPSRAHHRAQAATALLVSPLAGARVLALRRCARTSLPRATPSLHGVRSPLRNGRQILCTSRRCF